jgi:hypothetical protein
VPKWKSRLDGGCRHIADEGDCEEMNRRQFLNASAAAAVAPLIAGIAPAQQTAAMSDTLPSGGADGWTQLFNGRDLTGWYTYFPSVGKDKDPKGFVKVEDGMLHLMGNEVTGENVEQGYMATNHVFSNCRFRAEFKWGVKRFPPHEEAKRDNGLLYYVNGQDKVWPACVEFQGQESDLGDAYLLGGTRGKMGGVSAVAGPPMPIPAGEAVPPAPANNHIVKAGDFENRNDWNIIECVTRGDRSTHIVNGRIVMNLTNLTQPDPQNPGQFIPLTSGKLAVEVQWAEIWYRRIEVKLFG